VRSSALDEIEARVERILIQVWFAVTVEPCALLARTVNARP